jgi:formylglycine-generating enzyme required for sulfatase activity
MRRRKSAFVVASVAIASLWGILVRGHAQTSQSVAKTTSVAAEKPYDWKASFAKVPTGKVPRTRDGKPDLQGIWSFSVLTPLERPGGEKNTDISAAEAEEAENDAQQAAIDLRVEPTDTPPGEKTTDAYNSFWRDGYWYKVPMTTLHTSQVVDPPDGRIPPLIPAANERRLAAGIRLNRPATGPEDRPITSRCVSAVRAGPPILGNGPGSQETTMQIIQSPEMVVVRQEALHASQMVYLDGRPRPPESVHLNKGVSRGHWDGDTLVVESTNFTPWGVGNFSAYGNTDKLDIIERWKRLDDTHLLYGFTVDDPGTWTKPWSAEYVMWRLTNQEQLVEYACHEGNVGIQFSLSAARLKEKEALEAKAKENAKAPSQTLASNAVQSEIPAPVHPAIVPSAIVYASNGSGMEFAMIPPGEFQMGCSVGTKPIECSDDERPRHTVQITKAFEIGKTEVTEKQWQAVMGANPSVHKGDVDLPVENVAFEQVQDFLTKLNARSDGFVYRLPTEAEWEYAARAGTTDQYSGSLNEMAWYNGGSGGNGLINPNSALGPLTGAPTKGGSERGLSTHPVATKQPNAWGVFDMRGNVQEWVQDWYDPNYYSNGPVADPKGPATGAGRVVRGGSYHVYPWLTRVSLRSNFPEAYQFNDLGFRVVREKR